MNSLEEREEIERQEQAAASAWWNAREERRQVFIAEVKTRISRHRAAVVHGGRVLFLAHYLAPYLAYSYDGHGWVEVLSEAQGYPLRRLCRKSNDGAEFLVPDALLQGAPATGD